MILESNGWEIQVTSFKEFKKLIDRSKTVYYDVFIRDGLAVRHLELKITGYTCNDVPLVFFASAVFVAKTDQELNKKTDWFMGVFKKDYRDPVKAVQRNVKVIKA
jgi:hypothetical protein